MFLSSAPLLGLWLHHPPVASPAGAPRSMKMGTTRSPCRYDAVAHHALQSAILRRTAILQYACGLPDFPISQGSRLSFDSGNAVQSRDRRDVPTPDIC